MKGNGARLANPANGRCPTIALTPPVPRCREFEASARPAERWKAAIQPRLGCVSRRS